MWSKILTKLFLGILALLLIDLAIINWKVFRQPEQPAEPGKESEFQSPQFTTTTLEIATPSGKTTIIDVCGPDCIRTIEASISSVTKRVEKLEAAPKLTTVTTSQPQSQVFIPLGIAGASTSRTDWTTIDEQAVYLDPADFGGYKYMRLEGTMSVASGNGKAFARLYNTADGTSPPGSEMESSSGSPTLVQSAEFKLPATKKLYKLQLKSLTGYAASIGLSRIRVVF